MNPDLYFEIASKINNNIYQRQGCIAQKLIKRGGIMDTNTRIPFDLDMANKPCGSIINTTLTSHKLVSFLGYLLLAFLAGCATTAPRQAADKALLDFLEIGKTSKETVMLKLGQPSATFEEGQILTYRVAREKGGGYYLLDRAVGWAEIKFSLVLIFDNENVLRKHSLVEVR